MGVSITGVLCGLLTVGVTAANVGPARPADSLVAVARLQYGGGGDWYANPSSLPNLLAAVRERTGIAVAGREATVTALDPRLADYPFLYLTGHGEIRFSAEERAALKSYLMADGSSPFGTTRRDRSCRPREGTRPT